MRAVVSAVATWSRGGPDADLEALPPLPAGFHPAPDPERPEAVPPGAWRRMGRVARLAATCAARALPPGLDRETLPLFWGTMTGEYGATVSFVRSFALKGPQSASPLAFQHSVHNAPAGLLSMAFGLRGQSETLCAGPLTGLRVLERALLWVVLHQRPALAVCADELGPEVHEGLALMGAMGPFGEGAAAFLLSPEGPGVPIVLDLEHSDAPTWHRALCWPGESLPDRTDPNHAHDLRLGLYGSVDAVTLAHCVRARAGGVHWSGSGGPLSLRVDL